MKSAERFHTPSMLSAKGAGFRSITEAYGPMEEYMMAKVIADLERAGRQYRIVDTPEGKEIWTEKPGRRQYSKFDGADGLKRMEAA